MVAQGRSPLPRNVYPFDVPELDPPGIVLDTSVAIHAVFPAERYHAESRDFLIRLAQQETRLYFNDLLWAELLEAAFKLALKERFGNEWRRRRMDGRARRRAKRLVDDVAAAWDEILSYFIWATLPLEQALERVPELMGDFGLGSYDAVHVATGPRPGSRDHRHYGSRVRGRTSGCVAAAGSPSDGRKLPAAQVSTALDARVTRQCSS